MSLVLFAQPYDIEATGFSFSSLEEFKEKSEKNVNRYGQPVEEYEFQFISGDEWEKGQEALDGLGLECFLDCCDCLSREDIRKLEIVAHFEGWHSLSHLNDSSDVERYIEDCVIRIDNDETSLCYGLFEDYYCELFKQLTDLGAFDWFDYIGFLKAHNFDIERVEGVGYVYFENTK
jgi:hypothetical protein